MNLVTRAAWGARPPRSRPGSIPAGLVTIHWEGTPLGVFRHTTCPARVRGIQAFHMDQRDWNDIAYSAVVCPHGTVFEGRGRGQRTAANGTDQANNAWHAVCYLGGPGDPFTAEGRQGIRDAVAWLGGRQVNAHRDHKPTECPGNEIYAWVRAGGPLTNTGDPDMPLTDDDITAIGWKLLDYDEEIVKPRELRTRRLVKAAARHAGMTDAQIAAALNNTEGT